MDNNNIGGMNPQQFSQNTLQTSQPHMGMSGIELQKMQQEAEQRRREQSRRNADFFGRLCIPTIIYALLYTISCMRIQVEYLLRCLQSSQEYTACIV